MADMRLLAFSQFSTQWDSFLSYYSAPALHDKNALNVNWIGMTIADATGKSTMKAYGGET